MFGSAPIIAVTGGHPVTQVTDFSAMSWYANSRRDRAAGCGGHLTGSQLSARSGRGPRKPQPPCRNRQDLSQFIKKFCSKLSRLAAPGDCVSTSSRWSTRRSGRAHSRARPRLSDAQGSNLRAPSLVTGVQLLGLVCRELDDHRPHREHWRSRTGSTGGAAANPLSPAEMWQEMKIGIYLRRGVADRVCCVRR